MKEQAKGKLAIEENGKKNKIPKLLIILFIIIVLGLAYDLLFIK